MAYKDTRAALSTSLNLLSIHDKRRIAISGIAQGFSAIFDLIGVFLVGVLVSISVLGIQSKQYPENLNTVIGFLNLESFSFQVQVAILGVLTSALFLLKTFISALITRKLLYFLNVKASQVSSTLLKKMLDQPFDIIKEYPPTQILFALTRGVDRLIAGLIGLIIVIFSETLLLGIIFIGASTYNIVITIFCVLYFGFISWLLVKILGATSQLSQVRSNEEMLRSERQILESLSLYREFMTRNARPSQVQLVEKTRKSMAKLQSQVLFLPYVSKYFMEGSIIVGGLLLSATQFLKNDAITAITTLSIFLVAGTRVSPALLRLQQSYIQFKAFVGEVQTTLILINRIENSKEYKLEEKTLNLQQMTNEQDFDIEVRKLSFCYKNETQNAIYNVDFRLKFGKMLAIIGPSGSGKSTLVDLMLGALIPNTGEVRINGYLPRDFLKIHPGGLGFVAQESIFLDSSVRDNLLIGLETNSFPDSRLWEILEKVGLGRESKIFGFGLDTNLGNRGLKLSVGQRQRLSIARALLTRPKVLFLDEPTSSLDFESENLILNLIETLRNETSIVVIAHRLETIKNADLLLYLQNGSVKKFGTFEEVSSSTLDFL